MNLFEFLKLPDIKAHFQLMSFMNSFFKLAYFYFAIESGLVNILSVPKTKEEIKKELSVENDELFEFILKLGISIREIKLSKNKYSLKGSLSKALKSPAGEPLINMIKEIVLYYGDVSENLFKRIKGKEKGDYLNQYGNFIAQTSRLSEPFIKIFIKQLIKPNQKVHILEIGCGAGEYLKFYNEINPNNTGIGIDFNNKVVEQARSTITNKGLAEKYNILFADIRNPGKELFGPFDLITSFQNIYYFTDDERTKIFKDVLDRLSENGKFGIFSMFYGKKTLSSFFDIVLASTKDCNRLPRIKIICDELIKTGFRDVKKRRIFPGQDFWSIIAKK